MGKTGKYFFCLFAAALCSMQFITQANVAVRTSCAGSADVVKLTWEMLAKVKLVEKWSPELEEKINVPQFDITLQNLNRKEVIISGFVIPTTVDGTGFVLSKTPYASCYFCGNGGIETVMTIKYKGKQPAFKMDDFITLKGTLTLNSTNIEELIYILNDAKKA